MAILLFVFLLVLSGSAWVKPAVRQSTMVRAGAGLFLASVGLVMLIPALVTGLLFVVLAPAGIVLALVGGILSVAGSGRRLDRDVAALVASAQQSGRTWPDDPPARELDAVANHGSAAVPGLLSLLRFDSEDRLNDPAWSLQVEQQAALALCRIFGETAAAGRTVYGSRATSTDNVRVREFWRAVQNGSTPIPS